MMSNDELREQYDSVNLMAAQLKKIIRLWPALVIGSAIIGSIITLTVKAVHYDDNIVKKSDLVVISKQISELSENFEKYKSDDITDKMKIKNDLQIDISATNKIVSAIKYQCENINRRIGRTSFVTERRNNRGLYTIPAN